MVELGGMYGVKALIILVKILLVQTTFTEQCFLSETIQTKQTCGTYACTACHKSVLSLLLV